MPTFDTPDSQSSYTVPKGVTLLTLDLDGADGGGGADGADGVDAGANGGTGGAVDAELPVTDGENYTAYVGEDGGPASGANNGTAGLSPLADGGAGGGGGLDNSINGGGGGGGGGATGFERDSDTTVLAVAEAGGGGGGGDGNSGGGGGGGGARGGSGGAAGTGGNSGSPAAGTGNGGDGGAGGDGGDGSPGADGGTTTHADLQNVTATDGGSAVADGQVVITEQGITNFSIDAHTNTTISISWDDAPNEDNYRVEYSTDGGATWTEFSQPAAGSTSETITGLTEGTEYGVRVGADTSAGTSYTGSLTQTTDLPAPSGIDVTNADADNDVPGTSADITWTDNAADEDGYRVYLSTDQFDTKTNVSGDLAANTTTYTASGLLHGERYQVGVEVFTTDATILVTENV